MRLRNVCSIFHREDSVMYRTNEFDSSFHHRSTIPHSQHMSSQKSKASNQASGQPSNAMATFNPNQTRAPPSGQPSGYLPVNEDDGTYEVYEEPYEQPYAQQYQPGYSVGNPDGPRGLGGQGGRGHNPRLNSFVDSFESIN